MLQNTDCSSTTAITTYIYPEITPITPEYNCNSVCPEYYFPICAKNQYGQYMTFDNECFYTLRTCYDDGKIIFFENQFKYIIKMIIIEYRLDNYWAKYSLRRNNTDYNSNRTKFNNFKA